MHASLQKLSALPDHTQVCCAHEYTLSNLKFALAVEPTNEALLNLQRLVRGLAGAPATLPSHMAQGAPSTPFCAEQPAVAQAAQAYAPQTDVDATQLPYWRRLRNWKNEFR